MPSSSLRSPITLGDKTFEASPLSDDGRDALDEWVRHQYSERLAPMINQLEGEARKDMIREVMAVMPTLTFISAHGARFIGTIDGMAKLVYELIRPNHPDVKVEEIRQLMMDPVNLRKANAKFRELEGLDNPEPTPEGKAKDPSN